MTDLIISCGICRAFYNADGDLLIGKLMPITTLSALNCEADKILICVAVYNISDFGLFAEIIVCLNY